MKMNFTALAATAYTAAQTINVDLFNGLHAKGVRLWLDVTSHTAGTVDCKVQTKDHVSGKYIDMPSASFGQKTAAAHDDLVIFPGIAETANRSVSDVLTEDWRIVITLGAGAACTVSVAGCYLD